MDVRTTDPIAVTPAASAKIRSLAAREGRPHTFLRVRVTAGGCSGFRYELSFEDGPTDEDHVVEGAEGARVLIDPRSAPILEGSTLDFVDAMLGGGLKMLNPRATHECACGDSFAI